MSVLVTGLCWKHADVDYGTLLVLLAMADIADDNGREIWPRLSTLAAKCRLGERQVQRAIGNLKECGMVRLVETASGRPGRFNSYVIDLEAVIGSNPEGFAGNGARTKKGRRRAKTGDKLTPVPLDEVIHTGDICSRTGVILSGTGDICDAHIDNHPRSTLEPSYVNGVGSPKGAAAAHDIWEQVHAHAFWPLLKERLDGGVPVGFEDGALVVEFSLPSHLARALVIAPELGQLMGLKFKFRAPEAPL